MPSRRSFVAGLLATGLAPKAGWAEAGDPRYLSAAQTPSGDYVLCGLREAGDIAFTIPLPARGHAAAAHPIRPEAVAFARRPGRYALIIDCLSGSERATLFAPTGRHFYGHGAFSADGHLLFTTENAFDTARGVIGIWDAQNAYRRLGEVSSGGIGPHDIKLLPDRAQLVVANGGIETHPETGRTKLNLATMRSNLSYLTLDGDLIDQIELGAAHQKNSIRHLAVAKGGQVAFAAQWQGDIAETPALVGLHQKGQPPRLFDADAQQNRQIQGYIGSIAISEARGAVAVTAPRGGRLQIFDMRSGCLIDAQDQDDVCGIAPSREGFLATSGRGIVDHVLAGPTVQSRRHAVRWDNHLIAL